MLALLSRLTAIRQPSLEHITKACDIVKEALGASDAYVICGGDPHFTRLDALGDPSAYEIKQRGYWIVWRQLAANESLTAVAFTVKDRVVVDGATLEAAAATTHVACLLPADESNSELLVLRGPWERPFTAAERHFLEAARPILAALVARIIDADRQARHQEQLRALSEVARAFSEASEVDNVLQAVCTALAKASGFDWTQVIVVDEAIGWILDRAINISRHSSTETVAIGMQGNRRWLTVARDLDRTRKPTLHPDALAADIVEPELMAYYQRAHILSSGTFPMVFQDKLLGLIVFSSHTRREFSAPEVEFLTDLASQAATTIKGMRLYKQLEEASRIQHFLARTDALTGIPNRRYIEEVLRAEWARAVRQREPVSLVMADLDYFKRINDSIGHDAGDEALKHIAAVARQSCREADFVGRWGGDEFLFILPVTSMEGGVVFAERFREKVGESPFVPRGRSSAWPMTVSAGVAEALNADYAEPDSLFKLADLALYSAKQAGRDRVMTQVQAAAA